MKIILIAVVQSTQCFARGGGGGHSSYSSHSSHISTHEPSHTILGAPPAIFWYFVIANGRSQGVQGNCNDKRFVKLKECRK